VAVVSAAAVGAVAEDGVAASILAAAPDAISATAGADTSARIIDRSPIGVIATHDPDRTNSQVRRAIRRT
jgi:hypothetical protein